MTRSISSCRCKHTVGALLAAFWLAGAAAAQDLENLEPRERVLRAHRLFTEVLVRTFTEDPELRALLGRYQRSLQRASDRLDPEASTYRERLSTLASRHDVLQRDGRDVEARALLQEGKELRARLEELGSRARQSGETASLAQSLLQRMREQWGDLTPLDPILADLAADDDALLRLAVLLGPRQRVLDRGDRP